MISEIDGFEAHDLLRTAGDDANGAAASSIEENLQDTGAAASQASAGES
jgi:hypothetical protein